jgi:HAMP domain-containing protein
MWVIKLTFLILSGCMNPGIFYSAATLKCSGAAGLILMGLLEFFIERILTESLGSTEPSNRNDYK